MQCPNCHTQNPPQAKYCLECGNRLVVCPHCGTVNLPVAKFCIECGTSLRDQTATIVTPDPPPAAPSPSTPDSSSGSTVPVPAALLPPPEERRIVTVMFADITGSTPLADRLDPEDMRAILTGYFNLMTEQIRKHDGTVEKYIGDAVMAVFGLPITHEDDPDRAIRAALDMQSALARFNEQRLAFDPGATRLQMRIGINTGEVAAPGAATPQRQDFLITGDAVNIAARLQQMATPDTILVGERTYLYTRGLFDFRALAPLTLKGKPEPVCAYVVLGYHDPSSMIAQHPRGLDGRKVPLVGRTLELTFLHTSYALVLAERHPHLITILGAPGVGKSRLVDEFIAREQERVKSASASGTPAPPLVLKGRCPPYGEGITYWPLVEILRSLIGVREHESDDELEVRFLSFVRALFTRTKRAESPEEIASGVLRRIGRGLSNSRPELLRTGKDAYLKRLKDKPHLSTHHTTDVKQSEAQMTLLRSWRVLIEALAEEQPLIIVIDDLQWADEALLEFLEYLIERISNVPVLLLCPARPDFFERRHDWGGGKRNFTTLELEALTREESSELVDALLSTDDLPEALRNTILTRAEGNPFFVEEIIRMFIDQCILVAAGDPERQETHWHVRSYNEFVSEYATIDDQAESSAPGAPYLPPLPRIPDTIQGVLAARVDLLNPTEKLVLQNAAIIGRTFWLSALQELAPDLDQAAIQAALTALDKRDFIVDIGKQSRGLLEDDQAFAFKHILIRGVVYNNIPRIRRSQAHACLASWLEKVTVNQQERFVGLLAYHYQQALATWPTNLIPTTPEFEHAQESTHMPEQLTRDELRQRAITYLTLAGDQAINSYYTARAIQAYSDALDLMAGDDNEDLRKDIIKMHIKLGDAHFQRFDVGEAWQEYRRALRMAQEEHVHIDDDELLSLYERLALLKTRWPFNENQDSQEIRTYIDAGLAMLKGKPMSREKAAFVTYLAFWYIRQFEIASYAKKAELDEQAKACVHEALNYAEELNDPSLLSLVLDATSFVYCQSHWYEKGHQLQHRRLQLESQLTAREELFDLYYSLGTTHEAIADYASALMWFGRAWTCAQSMESPPALLSSMCWRMRTWRQWNRWEEARQVALDILHFIDQYQQGQKELRWALETLAVIAYRTGNTEEGDQYARQYKRLIEQQAERQGINDKDVVATSMHAIHLACEDWQRATADYQEKLRLSEPLPSPEVVSTLAELLITTGEGTAAVQEQICKRAITLSDTSRARKNMAIALRARGRLYTEQCQWERAENDLRASLRLCEELDLPWERGNTLYYLGMLYKRRAVTCPPVEAGGYRDDEGRARYYFEQALGFFESLNAAPAAQRARLALSQETTLRV